MDAKVFRMTLLTIISALILVLVIIYATNADKINSLFSKGDNKEVVEMAAEEDADTEEVIYGQQIGDDLNAFLYDDDFFDEAEQIPAVVVIQQNTKTVDDSVDETSNDISDNGEEEDGLGMAVVGQLDNPGAGETLPDGSLPGTLTEPPIEGTPVGKVP